ncbi:hypothetical protein KIN20_009609 [Parelaphostrongylus tenuis]|uniref:Uncharacterized protein n=1 Tax=Parelaphostrongylus tenuis TaxID=148309 RepID=A0AAD5QKR0_PARTN|nr:hypothetical protein KIN20_009609 [Parelaphostrongylus tenuis]
MTYSTSPVTQAQDPGFSSSSNLAKALAKRLVIQGPIGYSSSHGAERRWQSVVQSVSDARHQKVFVLLFSHDISHRAFDAIFRALLICFQSIVQHITRTPNLIS